MASCHFRSGSQPEVSDGHENVGFRGHSGSQFRATGCLFIAKRRHWRYPKEVAPRSLIMLREKLLKIGARMVRHGRYITFQLAEVAVSRQVFGQILARIARLRAPPVPA